MQHTMQVRRHPAGRGAGDRVRQGVFHVAAFALLSLGFVQVSQAGIISTYEATTADVRQDREADLQRFLARADVAAELRRFGVSADDVMARVGSLTDQEIIALQGHIEQQAAGGDAIAVIGVVFLVLLILELVGVTDIFKAI